MQLKSKQIRKTLATATCGLLAATVQVDGAQANADEWEINASTLFYNEIDRITVYEETLSLKKEIGDDEFVSLKRTHDIITGASPTGAAIPSSAQTSTTPSGSSVVNSADEAPLNEFRDIRTAYNFTWDKPLSRLTKSSWSANYSYEYDYRSIGVSGLINKDLESRITTLNLGLSGNFDRISPTGGGVPKAMASVSDDTRYSSDQKLMMDWLLGVARVINRYTLMSLTYMRGFSSGYLNDPYKRVSRLNVDGTPSGSEQFEKRPEERDYNSVHFGVIHQRKDEKYSGDVIDAGYRYYWDDWDITSHTLDVRYRHDVKKGKNREYWQGHARLYRQSAASFYTYGLPVLGVDPEFASADYRLSTMATATMGLLYGRNIFKDVKITVRGEYLRQWYLSSKLESLNAFSVQGSLYYNF